MLYIVHWEVLGCMVGKRIKRLRQKKGYSISELAKFASVSKSYLSQLERGLQTNPSLQFLRKIAIALDSNVDYFLEDRINRQNGELDEEWEKLIKQAIKDGIKKDHFREYLNYLKFQQWMNEQKK